MTKERFDSIFEQCKSSLMPSNENELTDRLKDYSKDIRRMSKEDVFAFLYLESMKYTNDMIYNVLVNCLDFED